MGKGLTKKQLEAISRATFNKCRELGLKHARENIPYIKNTILDLEENAGADSAIVVSAGPSLHIKDSARKILQSGFKGRVVCADGALYYCLRKGVVPDFVISVDPHPHRIIRFFGDHELKKASDDDYFRRQDLDPALNKDEIKRNEEITVLINRFGRRISALLSTSVSPKIARRCIEAGMKVYWWNPIYDDYDKKGSLTRRIYDMTGVPCMATGGNGGACAWVFTASVLKAKNIALVGMDFSYHPGTPLFKTQYYYEMKEIFKGRPGMGFIRVYNPYLKETWYTDPAYYWYKGNFLKLANLTDSVTYNCTEGGILFGRGIKFVKLAYFLERFNK